METRSIGPDTVTVVILVGERILDTTVDMGIEGLVKKAVAKFKEKYPSGADVDIDGHI
jgi:hypothetical protein